MTQEEITQFTQKNIAQGFKASQAFLKSAEILLQLQMNYIRENVEEQAQFAQQFKADTFIQDLSTLHQSRTQRIAQTGKEIYSLATHVQSELQQIAEEQQYSFQKEMSEKADAMNFGDATFVQKTVEQFWANTALAFNAFNQFMPGSTQTAKKAASNATDKK